MYRFSHYRDFRQRLLSAVTRMRAEMSRFRNLCLEASGFVKECVTKWEPGCQSSSGAHMLFTSLTT